MAILPLTIFPDPLLKEKSKIVEVIDEKTQKLMDDMIETMYDSYGVGLAAVQVGVLKRILVMDVDYKFIGNHEDKNITNKKPIFMVNPQIISSGKEINTYEEGCLSFPDIRANIKRPKKVRISYQDYNGKKQEIDADGLLATCVQHEIDHLNGITFVDYLSKIKKQILLKKLAKKLK